MKHREEITRSAGIVGVITLLSRIMGYARDMVVAYFFGARAETDAFYVAFRIPNLLRRLLAEGSLTVSFIPIFTENLEKKGKEEAKKISDIMFTLLFIVLILVSLVGVLLSPFIFNIVVIATVFLIQQSFDLPIFSLAIGVMIGGFIQVAFQTPFLRNRGFLYEFRKSLRHPAVKQIALLMVPQLFGLAVYNLNILVSTQYASHLPEGTVSYLYYSERLIEFPLGIVAVSIATALLPSLSSQASKGELERFRASYSFALRLMLFVMVPALTGLISLRVPICNLLYQRGEFSYEATIFTSQALLGYAVGLWAVGGVRITAPTFYAIQDTKSPVKIAFLAFIVNAFFGYILGFTFGLKHTGLALASSISSTFNFFLLFFALSRRMGEIEVKKTLMQVLKITLASLIMGVSAWKISAFYDWSQSGISLEKIGVFLASVLVSVALYFTIAKLLKVEEIGFLFDMIKRKARM